MLTGAALIAVIALLLSLGTSRVVIANFLALPDDAEIGEIAEATSDRRSRRTAQRAPTKRTLVDPIVRRNIFDPDATPKKPEPGGGKGTPSDLPLVLLATVVSTDPSFSSALIMEDSRDGAANGYGVGDEVMDAKVHSIEQKRVYLERDGSLEYLAIDGGPDPKKVPVGQGEDEDEDEDDGIRKVGENSWEVDQEVVDKHMGNLEKLAGSVRAVPHRGPDGEIDGYRLSAIRRGSLLDKLGVKNGDVFHAVNGLPLTSIDGAMKAFNSLQSDKSFNFELTRRNQKVTNEYAIQ